MKKIQKDVTNFHEKFGLLIGKTPEFPSSEICSLRKNLIFEEVNELFQAHEDNNLAGVVDGVADLIYVLIGMMVSYGVDMVPIWDATHKANMAKEGGQKRADGKILKPEGWKHPNIKKLLRQQEIK